MIWTPTAMFFSKIVDRSTFFSHFRQKPKSLKAHLKGKSNIVIAFSLLLIKSIVHIIAQK